MKIWKYIVTKLKQLFSPTPMGCTVILLGIFLASITLLALAQLGVVGANSYVPTELCSAKMGIQSNVEIDQLDSLTRVTNTSISSLGFVMPLYSKLNTSDIFNNNSRENILTLITTTPGITLGSITRALKIRNGTATHHLRILEREGYIKSKKTGKFRRYYVVGTKATGFNEIQDKILVKVEENPGISQSDIARELAISRQLINYHLQELVSSDVIYLEKLGNRSYCFLNN